MAINIYAKLTVMKNHLLTIDRKAIDRRRVPLIILGMAIMLGMTGCQSAPPAKAADVDNDVCIGDPVLNDPDSEIDLEEMAREVECP